MATAGKRPERRLRGWQNRVALPPGARFCWRKSGKSLGFGDWSPCKAIVRFLVEWKIQLLIVTPRSVLLSCASFWGRTLKDGHGGAVDRAWN
jgi:hypothetical protein